MKTIGIVGAGTMGAGIAQVAALSGYDVILSDISEEKLGSALQQITADMKKAVEKNKLLPDQAKNAASRILTRVTFDDFARCDVVIEAAMENLDIKKEIFKQLESICSAQTILATNTSSLSITAIASAVKLPERVIGMHFFNPPHIMKLVEVVRGNKTSSQATQRIAEFAMSLGKVPVVVKDNPGFIVNRVARPFYGEALRLLGEGVASVEDIDRIMKLEGGFKMGPFELMDLIGVDVNLSVTQSMYEQTFGEARYRPHIIQKKMVDSGLLGKKTKRGFYGYDT
jgi:3-hydroxybutyryl-CoA dehydrogenase